MFQLSGARVALRDFAAGDATAVFAYHGDREVMRHLPASVRANRTPDANRALLRKAHEDAARVPRVKYDLAVTVEHDVVGAARLHRVSPENADGEIGYILRRDRWGEGLGTEIAGLLIGHGFTGMELSTISAIVDRSNVASMRVLEKLGMRADRALGSHRQRAQGRGESLVYVLGRSDWDESTRTFLA
jgi:RimJ/RimL family protein N-acetyltransferase